MSNQEQKQESTTITPQPEAENKKESGELTEEELKKATGGGGVSIGDISITSKTDTSSAKL